MANMNYIEKCELIFDHVDPWAISGIPPLLAEIGLS